MGHFVGLKYAITPAATNFLVFFFLLIFFFWFWIRFLVTLVYKEFFFCVGYVWVHYTLALIGLFFVVGWFDFRYISISLDGSVTTSLLVFYKYLIILVCVE